MLAAGDARLAVDLRGGGMRRLVVDDWDVIDGYPAGAVIEGWRGAVLVPWPNRVRDGRWNWRGRGAPARRGLARAAERHARPRRLAAVDTSSTGRPTATSVGTILEPHAGYPFRLGVAVDYALGPDRLDGHRCGCATSATAAAPVGVGMHPYLHVGAHEDGGIGGAELTVPARTALEIEGGLPTGVQHRFHGDVGRIGHRAFDTPLTDLERDDDGWARLRLRGPLGRDRARRRRVLAVAAGLQRRRHCRTGSGGAASPSSR